MTPLKLLVVDDDAVDRQLIERAFKSTDRPLEITFVESGQQALDCLLGPDGSGGKFRPDLCLFDINMPGISGFELLTQVKSHNAIKKIPVVMLSSSDDRKDIRYSYELQASGYVRKPGNMKEFNRIAKSLVDYWGSILCLPDRSPEASAA
jgi:CheY-like chemotaxis protein